MAAFDVRAKGDNPMCGDRVEVFVAWDDAGKVAKVGFEARGCAISVASADLMADSVAGLSAAEVRDLAGYFATLARKGSADDIPARFAAAIEGLRALAGVHEYPSRVKCATLPWHALVAALDGAGEASSERD
ncbi:Fe-S cluster assembling protein of nitrogenase NifU-SUF [Acidisphaera rubrifaciens HS-AP3]|uniref:Fe-S cluster assembling protein of nitrogenase NifU-SUF n=1 Tax=Acidisphaera rubrifaciens HS-AP3 TaxID=1231350 RepID=A0A0D6P2Y7_9PROT|nr:Fe-S cluster assembling protein of nitrogenase NifU-SUF [Acidisphaera rubrifaciens HS-AP3]